VIDKDLATEPLAREPGADLYLMLTDADAVHADRGKPTKRAIHLASPDARSATPFAAGSMGRRSRPRAASCAPPSVNRPT